MHEEEYYYLEDHCSVGLYWEPLYLCSHNKLADPTGIHLVRFLKADGDWTLFNAKCNGQPKMFDDARMQGPIPKEWWR